MVTKIVLTLLVIAGCYFYLKRRNAGVGQSRKALPAPPAQRPVKWLAGGLLTVSLLGLFAYVGYRWYDSHTLLAVRVITPGSDNAVIYQVYKGDLADRSFTTVQGQTVRIAVSERLEISRPAD